MATCPKCSFTPVSGRFCGKCGAVVSASIGSVTTSGHVAEVSEHRQDAAVTSRETLTALEQTLKKNPGQTVNYVNLANAQADMGRYEQAFSTFRAVRAIAPDDTAVLKTGARIFELMNRREESIECLKKAIKIDKNDSDAIFRLAGLLYDSGKKEEALQWLEELYRRSQSQPDILIRIAQIHLSLGNAAEAQEYLARYKELAGSTREMFLLLGQTMLARKFFDGAVKNFREAGRAFPEDAEMRLGLGRAYLGMGEKGQALLEFEQALNKSPDNIDILIELGKLQNSMGMEDRADQTFASIEKAKPANGECFLGIALHFIERGNLARATKYLDLAHELSPYHPDIQQTLGRTLARQKKFAEALKIFQNAVEAYPDCQWGHEGIVSCAAETKNFVQKAASQKRLLEIRKSSAEDWCDYGETLIRLGQFDAAQDAFEAASRLDPTCVRAYQSPELIKIEKARAEGEKLAAQGCEALQKKFFLTAAERLEKALDLVPNQPDWVKMLAEVSLKTAEIERASSLLLKARSFDASDFDTSFNLARVYEYENKVQTAIELLTTLTRDHPARLDAHLMLLRLKRGQIRGNRVEPEMLEALTRNIELELAHIRRDSPVPLLVKGYANYLFGMRAKFQSEGLMAAEKVFHEVQARFGENEAAIKGLALCERARGNVEKAVEYARSLVKLSSDPQQLYELARLHENFQQFGEARKCYASLRSLFPENGHYRRKMLEVTAEVSKISSKNDLMNLLSEHHQALQAKPDQIWLLYETAIGQELAGEYNAGKEEWVKRSLLNWHKAINHPSSNHWVRWAMIRCQFRHLKGQDRQRAAANNLKACEKIMREMPDSAMAFQAIARCYLAMGDLANTDKALTWLEKAWFLASDNAETGELLARTARELGKSVIVDSVGYNMLLLEPELANSIFQL
ncbi:MAG: tetratricopeptide repeat protein [Candidatus Riflebacteria bacterium]|nr:tetratricopeptide repeat protein [Candidatus Riflebacteria bacterium]